MLLITTIQKIRIELVTTYVIITNTSYYVIFWKEYPAFLVAGKNPVTLCNYGDKLQIFGLLCCSASSAAKEFSRITVKILYILRYIVEIPTNKIMVNLWTH